MAGLLCHLNVQRLKHESLASHIQLQGSEFPIRPADILLFEQNGPALLQLADNAPAEINVLDEVGLQANQPFLRLIDQDITGHAAKDGRLNVGRLEVRIGQEAQVIARSTRRLYHALKTVEESLRQK